MKITYDIINENLRVFEEAKEKFPIIKKYINGEVPSRSLSSVGLGKFPVFHDYMSRLPHNRFIIGDMTWRKLKPILIERTESPRFKTYLKNRTQNQFNDILKDHLVYDRLLNGRWIRKPGRRSSGSRSNEKMYALDTCRTEIINYIIQNDLDVCEQIIGSEWFVSNKLSFDDGLIREMRVTEDMITSIVDVISESKVDFKKLNTDYITNYISEKLLKLVHIEKGSVIKCIKNVKTESSITRNSTISLKEGNSYIVDNYTIRNGYLQVWVTDETGRSNYHPFSNFEDMKYHRNSILDDLLNS